MVFATEKEKEEFDERIVLYKNALLNRNKNLTEDEALLLARQVLSNLNISFVLADVLNSFMSDAESALKSMGMMLSSEDKHRFLLTMPEDNNVYDVNWEDFDLRIA